MRNHTAAYKGGKKAACRSIERRGGSRSGLAMQRLAVSLVRIGEIAPGWGGVDSERAVEIGVEAECFNADLVVMPPARGPSPGYGSPSGRAVCSRAGPRARSTRCASGPCGPSPWPEAQPRIESTTAKGSVPWTNVACVTPIMRRASVSGIFIGPGDGALPGAG